MKNFNVYCEDNEVELPKGVPVSTVQAPQGSPWTEGPNTGSVRRKRDLSSASDLIGPGTPIQDTPKVLCGRANNQTTVSPSGNIPSTMCNISIHFPGLISIQIFGNKVMFQKLKYHL